MSIGIKSRRAVVTGGAKGLGLAMAAGLLRSGHQVLLVDKDERALAEACSQLSEGPTAGRIHWIEVDLTAHGATDLVMNAVDQFMGGIDVLVNNAGVGPAIVRKDYFANPPVFDELGEPMVRLFFELNSIAPFLLSIAAARRMRKQEWGRIINVTTSHDSMLRKGFAPYGGTKAALESHSAIMAQDLAGSGVTLNVLVPGGPADTDMIPPEAGFERASLIRPEVMVPPLEWIVADGANAPNGRRILAALWEQSATHGAHPSVTDIGWESTSKAIIPQASVKS